MTEPTPVAASRTALPAVLRGVYATSAFVPRLALYDGVPIGRRFERFFPLVDYWAEPRPEDEAVRARVLAHTPEIETDLATLRAWTPPPAPNPGTLYADVYRDLAERYLACREIARIRRLPPGPLDARHPGFVFVYDPKRRLLDAHERKTPTLTEPRGLAFGISLEPGAPVKFPSDALDARGTVDAWELFALRALLLALVEPRDGTADLQRELGRPLWEHVLDRLDAAKKEDGGAEWTFAISPSRVNDFEVVPFARKAGKKTRSWRRATFTALFADEATSELEREIARCALASTSLGGTATLDLHTPQGHALVSVLAKHPRVTIASARADPARDPNAMLVVGRLTMRLEQAPNGYLLPRFFVDEEGLSASMLSASRGPFRGVVRGAKIVSVFVPPALRGWLDMAAEMGDAFAFPPEAVARLAASAEALIASGLAELPREALGVEIEYSPSPALAIDWRPEGGAVVEVLVSIHARAPLVEVDKGPDLFTFEIDGRRAYIERDRKREAAVASEAYDLIEAPLVWERGIGRTETLQDALVLARFLDANPRRWRIEVRVGHAPRVVPWAEATRTLQLEREGSWLVLDGDIDVDGKKISIGEVLDAARHARSFVAAGPGLFVELGADALARLEAVAFATDLAGDTSRVHEAFAPAIEGIKELFTDVTGTDLGPYLARFQGRSDEVDVAPLEHSTLRSYQSDGVAWMLRLASWAPGCIVADDMGLGKTVQTASVLKTRAALGPALVVAPASVASNWVSELARFMPSLDVVWWNEDRAVKPRAIRAGGVLIVSYGLLQRRIEDFRGTRWATLVVDEAQYVKNLAAERSFAVRAIDRDFSIALTGTPLENHLGELFAIVDLAFPGLLGGDAHFRDRFRRPIEGRGDGARLASLSRLLAPFLLRRTRAAVLEELPPRAEITEHLDLGPKERRRYLALRKACEEQFKKRERGETPAQLKIALLAALTRLRQLACDPRLVDADFAGEKTKIGRVVELVTEIAAEENHALVFSQFAQFLDLAKTALENAGLRVGHLDGSTPAVKRRAIIDAFQAGAFDVFCVSLLAGGTGLNLTRASYVIHLDPWWNPAAEEQATSRAHRMGQSSPVTVIRLVARGTIEEAVLDMHGDKRELAAAVLEGKDVTKPISPAELMDLLRFGA